MKRKGEVAVREAMMAAGTQVSGCPLQGCWVGMGGLGRVLLTCWLMDVVGIFRVRIKER